MFDPFTLALIGGAIGGLTNKKNPLEGALLGAAGGYGGGALLGGGGLLSTPAAAAEGVGAMSIPGQFGAMSAPAANGSALSLGSMAGQGANPAFNIAQPTMSMSGLLKDAKPYMEAAGTGMQVANATKQEERPIVASPVMQPAGPNMPMNNLMQNINNMQAQRLQEEKQRRMRRQSLLGG